MTLSPTDFDYVRNLVRKDSAIALDDGKQYLAVARLETLARREGIDSCQSLVARLRAGQQDDLRRKVVEAMTTNETMFFRDVKPFEVLRDVLLPELIRSRARERCIRFWSAACSTGQEPYSLAILIREHFPELASWDISILATDLSREAIEKAREGRYTQMEVNRGMPASLLLKYFRRSGLHWHLILDEVRRMVQFREMNLIDPWPAFPPMDVVLMRNVLIYFDVETKKRLLSQVADRLNPRGFLGLGGAETTLFLDTKFTQALPIGSGYFRLGGA
jgi:chemotaxis protein methyltransferase CheR